METTSPTRREVPRHGTLRRRVSFAAPAVLVLALAGCGADGTSTTNPPPPAAPPETSISSVANPPPPSTTPSTEASRQIANPPPTGPGSYSP